MKSLLSRCIIIATLISTAFMASAQEKEDTLCIGQITYRSCYEPVKSIFTATDNSYIDKLVVVDNDQIFGNQNDGLDGNYPVRWVLTETSDRTILHCYLKMTIPTLLNVYLGGIDKASITDLKTGNIYEARGSYDPQVWERAFNISAPVGTVLDFPIEFPLLPKDVREIFIYGVPLCGLNGVGDAHNGINIRDENFGGYDEMPHLKLPRLIKPESAQYDSNDWDTWAAYADIHTVRPCKDGTMALWRTPDATYLTLAYEQNWRTEYFAFGNELVRMFSVEGNKELKLRKVHGLPDDGHWFMSHAEPGSWVCFTLEFDPMPLSVENVVIVAPLEGKGIEDTSNTAPYYVNSLRSNQKYFEYYKPEVTLLNASPMDVKTVASESLSGQMGTYKFTIVDSKTKKPLENVTICLMNSEMICSARFRTNKDGYIEFGKAFKPSFILITIDGYESVIKSASEFKGDKTYLIRLKKTEAK